MNMIRKTLVAIKGGPGGVGIWAYKTSRSVAGGRLFIDRRGGTAEPIASDRVVKMGASDATYTLTAQDDGLTLIANNAAATVVVTLPDASVAGIGAKYTVVTGALPGAGAGTTVTPASGDNINAKAADATLVNSAASDAVGDSVTLVSDGATTWFTVAKIGTWA
jgi:hypothetical protein